MSVSEWRAERLSALVKERELDVLLVTNLVNIRYVCGFSGTNGVCVVDSERRVLVTDFRYIERAGAEAPGWDVVRGKRDLLDAVAASATERASGAIRIGFDDAQMTERLHRRLAELLPGDAELVHAAGIVEELRAVKDPGEVRSIREAAKLADELYTWLIEDLGLSG